MILQLNQYTLGRNNNVNNVGEEVKKSTVRDWFFDLL